MTKILSKTWTPLNTENTLRLSFSTSMSKRLETSISSTSRTRSTSSKRILSLMRRQSSTLPCSSTRQSPKSQTENRRALSSHTHPQIHSQCKTGSQRWCVEAVTRVQAIRTSISLTKSQIKLSLRRQSLKERAESQPLCPMILSASFHAMLQR